MAKKDNGGFVLGALLGAAVAGLTALLYTPKSGEELRKIVSKDVDKLIDRARDYKDTVVERGVEMYDSAAEVASEKSEDIKLNVQLTAENLKNQFNDLKEDGKKFVAKKEEQLDELTEDIEIEVNQAEEKAQEFAEDLSEDVADKAGEFKHEVADKAEEMEHEVSEKVDEIQE